MLARYTILRCWVPQLSDSLTLTFLLPRVTEARLGRQLAGGTYDGAIPRLVWPMRQIFLGLGVVVTSAWGASSKCRKVLPLAFFLEKLNLLTKALCNRQDLTRPHGAVLCTCFLR